jgi:DNA-binding response OmpR family regulator
MGMIRILLAEDNDHQRKTTSAYLKLHQYEVLEARDGLEALQLLENNRADLVVCDVMMPNMDGFELTKALRAYDKHLPILIITAKGDADDKQIGFLAGTDDYMVKPIDYNEMLLRITALLRRSNIEAEHSVCVGDVAANELEGTVTHRGKVVPLTKREFELLFMFLSYPNKMFTRRQLIDSVWGYDCDSDERTVDVHVNRIRDKLGDAEGFRIATVHGIGYRLEVRDA